MLAACLTGLLIPLCFTGPAVALPTLGAELHGSAAALNWVINAYILSYGSAMMVAGSLTDVLGRRRVWLTGLALFCAATLAIAVAPSVAWIAALRFVQGLGGAAAFAAAMSSLAPLFHGAARNRVMSVLGTTFGLGLAFGPLAAGAMLALARWPAIFYATAALGAVGMLLVWGSVPADPPRGKGRLDWIGALSFSAALALLTLAMLLAPEHGWRSGAVLLSGAASMLLFLAFGVLERRTAQPLLDLSLFRQRRFIAVQVLAASPAFLFIVLIVMLPGRFIGIDNMSALAAGRLMTALAAPLLLVPMLAALLLRWITAGTVCAAGLLLAAAGLAWLPQVLGHDNAAALIGPLLLIGAGIGLPWGLMDGMALNVVETERAGMATGIFNTVRISADGLALALAGAVLAGLIGACLARQLPAGLPMLAAASRAALGDIQQATQLLGGHEALLRASYDAAFRQLLNGLAGLAVALAALVPYLLRREEKRLGVQAVENGHEDGDIVAGAGKCRCRIGNSHAGSTVTQVDKAEHGARAQRDDSVQQAAADEMHDGPQDGADENTQLAAGAQALEDFQRQQLAEEGFQDGRIDDDPEHQQGQRHFVLELGQARVRAPVCGRQQPFGEEQDGKAQHAGE